jgi:hypothetical protein
MRSDLFCVRLSAATNSNTRPATPLNITHFEVKRSKKKKKEENNASHRNGCLVLSSDALCTPSTDQD